MERPVRILVSEDTPMWQGIFKRLLAQEKFEVRSATTLKETKWQLDSCSFDLVLVDISLDENNDDNTDGLETLRMISNLSEGTQAIVLTGHGTVDLAVMAVKKYDVFHFLEKEKFNPSIFLDHVKNAVKKANITQTQLGLSKDTLSSFRSINFENASSMLEMKQDRLQFFLKHFIRKTSPIVPQESQAKMTGTGKKALIILDYWSKAFACGAHLVVGNREVVTLPSQNYILVSLEEENIIGFVEALKDSAYEDYLGQ